MFKKLKYNLLGVFIFTIIATLSCCDGRAKLNKNPKQILADKGMLTSFSERINYMPESPSETITDTILHTGYKVYIKTYSDMNSNVIKAALIDNINIKTFYRNALADVSVKRNDKTIFNQTISKAFITENIETTPEALQSYILKSIWIDDNHISSKESVIFNILFNKAEDTTKYKSFLLTISKEGDYKITETTTKI
ncbi:hypothetical protein ACFFVB_11750 [Formosa undariae]|uniref:DUF4878 domain-containing protein n=1 Tax=Formosa undariae TaxID=1325436 RepID=A0ABV5F2W7_9FLAO